MHAACMLAGTAARHAHSRRSEQASSHSEQAASWHSRPSRSGSKQALRAISYQLPASSERTASSKHQASSKTKHQAATKRQACSRSGSGRSSSGHPWLRRRRAAARRAHTCGMPCTVSKQAATVSQLCLLGSTACLLLAACSPWLLAQSAGRQLGACLLFAHYGCTCQPRVIACYTGGGGGIFHTGNIFVAPPRYFYRKKNIKGINT
jgi:hypothetical protein